MIASAVLVREKTVAPRVLTKILRLYQRCFLIKLIKTAFRFSNFSLSSWKQIIKDGSLQVLQCRTKQCPRYSTLYTIIAIRCHNVNKPC
jgi:hypothetical protein